MVNHWTWYTTISSSINEPFVPNEDKFGFVYIITNTKTSKAYVGCKQYYLGKSKKQSSWQTYMGSSKYLKEDIKKIGKEHFTFEVIAEYKNKRSLRYYEAYYQMKWDVLTHFKINSDHLSNSNFYTHFNKPRAQWLNIRPFITIKKIYQSIPPLKIYQ